MLAVILAGGFGTRLRPLTYTTPKPLLPVANKALIEYTLDALPPEVDEVALAVGYKAEAMEAHFQRHPPKQSLRVVVESKPLGTGGAIRNAIEELGNTEETFLVRNADLLDTLPIPRMVEFHRKQNALATISLWTVEDPSPFGVAKMNGPRIEFFVEKPKREDAPTNLINAGTYLLEPEVLDYFPDERDGEVSIERSVFPELVATDRGMAGFPFEGHWVDCGRPDTYLDAHRAIMNGQVKLGRGARMSGETKGFAAIGANAVVEADARLEDSILLPGAHVERGATLVRSIVGAHARVGAKATLEDAIIGDGAAVPPGSTLRGAKLPEVKA
jgi:mannose-1-phosphate guanylyltransferase